VTVRAAVERAHSEHWGRLLALLTRLVGNLDVAEESLQDAYEIALTAWERDGVPDKPDAWLLTAARRRATDRFRREATLARKLPLLAAGRTEDPEVELDMSTIPDERLRLLFTCCHPALPGEARIALTLRLLGGLTTAEIARAFLVAEPTMAARITRAKKKIALARIPYRVPAPDQLAERVAAVLEVVHLIFTTGHAAPSGPRLVRRDLVDCAIGLARTLHLLMPVNTEVSALLAVLLLVDARGRSRTSREGRLLLLAEQDRASWDRKLIAEGVALVTDALRRSPPTRFAVQAAIAAVHAEAPSWEQTDWTEIVGLYDVLLRLWPSPVVELNRAVAIGLRDGPEEGLAALDPLLAEPVLATYGYLSAARADFLRRLRRWPAAAEAYREALALTDNDVEREFLAGRLAEAAKETN
jgi:RNA polymerase sigma-70 factor (ECF subfamily)